MSSQYISDSSGNITDVFIPISEWNELKNRLQEIEEIEIPAWQKNEVRRRNDDFKKNPEQALDFEEGIDDIEKSL